MNNNLTIKMLIAKELLSAIEKTPAFMDWLDEAMKIRKRHKLVLMPDDNCLRSIRPEEILYIEAEGNYSVIHFITGKKLTVAVSLGELVKIFTEYGIVRCHRGVAVNINAIEVIGGNYLELLGKVKVDMGKTYKDDVLAHFNVVGSRSKKYT